MFQLRLTFQLDLPYTSASEYRVVERRSGGERRVAGREGHDRRVASAQAPGERSGG